MLGKKCHYIEIIWFPKWSRRKNILSCRALFVPHVGILNFPVRSATMSCQYELYNAATTLSSQTVAVNNGRTIIEEGQNIHGGPKYWKAWGYIPRGTPLRYYAHVSRVSSLTLSFSALRYAYIQIYSGQSLTYPDITLLKSR